MAYKELKQHDLVECVRCGKTEFAGSADNWNAVFDAGVIVCFICPECQTDEEHLEAEVNEATVDYSKSKTISTLDELLDMFHPLFTKALRVIADGEMERGNDMLNEYLERFRKGFNALYRYDFDAQLNSTEEAFALLKKLGEFGS